MRSPRAEFFFRAKSAIIDAMFRDLPVRARELKATPEMLERIYDAARLGLRGESLALAAGMLPAELARLKIMDPIAEVAEMKGRADSEMEMSRVVFDAAQAGDSKAALEFLKHRHDWVATQKVEVQGSAQISITVALEEAQKRVERIAAEDAVVIESRSPAVLPLARETLGDAV
jgi:predicted transcriptional regulator